MKKSVKMLCFVLILCLSLSCISCKGFSVSAEPFGQNDKIDNLVENGIPREFLLKRSVEEIDLLYDMAQEYVLEYKSEQELYDDNQIATYGTINENHMTLTVSKVEAHSPPLPGSPSRLDSVAVFVDYIWVDGRPLIKHEDAITVNWDSSVFLFVPDSFNSYDRIEVRSDQIIDYSQDFNVQANPAHLSQGGLGYYANLMFTLGNDLDDYLVRSGSASFMLEPRSTIYVGSDLSTSIAVEYTHDKNPVGLGVTLEYHGFGVTVSAALLQDSVAKAMTVTYSD